MLVYIKLLVYVYILYRRSGHLLKCVDTFNCPLGLYIHISLSGTFVREVCSLCIFKMLGNFLASFHHQYNIAILEFKGELPEGQHMRVENKNFYFDIGQNSRGIYMRISEVISFCIFYCYSIYLYFAP